MSNDRPPFIGRARPLAVLAEQFSRAAAAEPRIVWVEGESGMGKTQLVRHFLGDASATHVIRASAEQDETSLAFGVIDQLWAALRRIRPALAETGTSRAPTGPSVASPMVVGAELLAAVGELDGTVVLVVDDLQWIDADSGKSLLFLLRRLQAEPMLAVLISQPDPGPRLGDAWSRLLGDADRVTHLRLGGLSPEEVVEFSAALGQGELSPALAARLHEHTRGHPLHTRSLLQELGVEGLRAARSLPAPRSLSTLVVDRFEALPVGAQDFLAAGAVLGATFPVELATLVARLDDPIDALEAAMGSGLLERRPDGSLSFGHPLVHAAIYNGLSPSRRHRLHAAAAGVTSGATALHHRVSAAAGPDADLAGELAARAAIEADAGAHSQAADYLEAAARLTAHPQTRERLLLEAVEMMYVGGDFVRAAAMRPVVEACGEGPRRTCVLGLMAFASGRLREAESLLDKTLESVSADERLASWGTRAATNLAFARLLLGDWEGALAAAETALAGDLKWERSVSQFSVVVALTRLGRVDEARRRLVEETGDTIAGNRPGTLDVLAARGMASLVDDDLPAARQDLAAVVRRARAGERIRMHEFALVNLAEVDYLSGQWDEALTNIDLAISLAAESGRTWAFVSAHSLGATIRASLGRYAEAEAHLREADSVARESDSWLSHGRTAIARAALADVRGDFAGMVTAFEEALRAPLRGRQAAQGPANWRVPIVEALVGCGRLDEAAVAVGHLTALLAARPMPSYEADGARLRGLLAEARGDHDEAAAAYASGPTSLDGPNPLGRARLALVHGAFLGRQGQRRAAVERVREARARFAALGAVPFVERCDAQLEELGLTRGADPVRGPFDLTDAERRVARMVADGLSNREAAERLYISPKTVEYHLGNVYAKLGISSRWMLADRLRELSST